MSDIRLLSNITPSDVADSDIISLIQYSTAQINRQINTNIEKMRVLKIDWTKLNTINGSNCTFFLNCYPIADYNNDGEVNTTDVLIYDYDSNWNETTLEVTSIDEFRGMFKTTVAPQGGHIIRVTYAYAPKLVKTSLDPLVRQAATELTCALAFNKIEAGRLENFSLGKLRVTAPQKTGARKFYDQYYNTVRLINARLANRVEYDENTFMTVGYTGSGKIW